MQQTFKSFPIALALMCLATSCGEPRSTTVAHIYPHPSIEDLAELRIEVLELDGAVCDEDSDCAFLDIDVRDLDWRARESIEVAFEQQEAEEVHFEVLGLNSLGVAVSEPARYTFRYDGDELRHILVPLAQECAEACDASEVCGAVFGTQACTSSTDLREGDTAAPASPWRTALPECANPGDWCPYIANETEYDGFCSADLTTCEPARCDSCGLSLNAGVNCEYVVGESCVGDPDRCFDGVCCQMGMCVADIGAACGFEECRGTWQTGDVCSSQGQGCEGGFCNPMGQCVVEAGPEWNQVHEVDLGEGFGQAIDFAPSGELFVTNPERNEIAQVSVDDDRFIVRTVSVGAELGCFGAEVSSIQFGVSLEALSATEVLLGFQGRAPAEGGARRVSIETNPIIDYCVGGTGWFVSSGAETVSIGSVDGVAGYSGNEDGSQVPNSAFRARIRHASPAGYYQATVRGVGDASELDLQRCETPECSAGGSSFSPVMIPNGWISASRNYLFAASTPAQREPGTLRGFDLAEEVIVGVQAPPPSPWRTIPQDEAQHSLDSDGGFGAIVLTTMDRAYAVYGFSVETGNIEFSPVLEGLEDRPVVAVHQGDSPLIAVANPQTGLVSIFAGE